MATKKTVLLLGGLIMTLTSCYRKPIDIEQYKNEVYIVNAYNRVYDIDYEYKPEGEYATNFITISSSGTLPITEKAMVSLTFADELVQQYNIKYIGDLEAEKYKWYKLIDYDNRVKAEGFERIVIEPKDSIRKNLNIHIQTFGLDPDINWALPISILESAPYPISINGKNIMLKLNLINDYSGHYNLVGRDSVFGELRSSLLKKTKKMVAVSSDEVRLFYAASTEGRNYVDDNAIVLKINSSDLNDDGHYPVSIRGWRNFSLENSYGIYDPKTKTFQLRYEYTKDGLTHQIRETLTLDKTK